MIADDLTVFPDLDGPPSFATIEDRADYVDRICSAWDFGFVPTAATFELFVEWRDVFDAFPRTSSGAYAAFRAAYGWPDVACLLPAADYERWDAREARTDPTLDFV